MVIYPMDSYLKVMRSYKKGSVCRVQRSPVKGMIFQWVTLKIRLQNKVIVWIFRKITMEYLFCQVFAKLEGAATLRNEKKQSNRVEINLF